MRYFSVFISLLIVSVSVFASHAALGQRLVVSCDIFDDNHDKNIACYNRLIKSGQLKGADLAHVFHNRAGAYYNKGEIDHAIADYDQALRYYPTNGSVGRRGRVFELRARAYLKKGDFDRAIADYSQGLREPDPATDTADLHHSRGEAYLEKGDFDRAIADFNQALNIFPMERTRNSLKRARAALAAQYTPAFPAAPKVAPPANIVQQPSVLPVRPNTVTPSTNESRVALVIGNSNYQAVAALANPRRDADAVAAALRAIGFQTVTLKIDLSRNQLIDALHTFSVAAEKADWAVVYFAGHGIEVGGLNYLIPIDAKLQTDRDVQYEAVALDQVLGAVEGAKKLRLILLDACRDNPFLRQMRRSVASRSIGRGLGSIEPDAGTLVVYAAKHGEVALDGDSANSPFVTALLKDIATPGVEIRKLFDLVRDDVMDATHRRQQPYTYGSLPGRQDFYFVQK